MGSFRFCRFVFPGGAFTPAWVSFLEIPNVFRIHNLLDSRQRQKRKPVIRVIDQPTTHQIHHVPVMEGFDGVKFRLRRFFHFGNLQSFTEGIITHVDDFIPWDIQDGSVQAKHLNPVFIDMDDHAVFTVTGRKINRTDIDRT